MAEASATPIIENAPEEWRSVVGFEGIYEVSNHGRCRRICGRPPPYNPVLPQPKVLKPTMLKVGYFQVYLGQKPLKRKAYLHALIAEAFIGPRPPAHEIAHLDGDRANSVLSNLAYVTASENSRHKLTHGTDAKAKLSPEQVRELRRIKLERPRTTMKQLAAMFGLSRTSAHKIWRRRSYQDV